MNRPTVIVGASVAGVRLAQLLRRGGSTDDLILLDQELGAPYDKPHLSKHVLTGELDAPRTLATTTEMATLGIDFRPDTTASALDVAADTVHLQDGASLTYSHLVIATGSQPRRLPAFDGLRGGVHYLRTSSDATELKAALLRGTRIVIIGGGFIGAEVAAAARTAGLDVTIIETAPHLAGRVLPPGIGDVIAELHRHRGVDVLCGRTALGPIGWPSVTGVLLDDGTVLPADLVLIGIGTRPSTEWLAASGLALEDGVLCNSYLRAINTDNIYAAGDVARWYNPRVERLERVEHWTNAREHAAVIADNLNSQHPDRPCTTVPYVWSDQYDSHIQHVGHAAQCQTTEVSTLDNIGRLFLHTDSGELRGATAIDAPHDLLQVRRELQTAPLRATSAASPHREL